MQQVQLNESICDEDNLRKKVLIIYTGGTMGMVHNELGALEPQPG